MYDMILLTEYDITILNYLMIESHVTSHTSHTRVSLNNSSSPNKPKEEDTREYV